MLCHFLTGRELEASRGCFAFLCWSQRARTSAGFEVCPCIILWLCTPYLPTCPEGTMGSNSGGVQKGSLAFLGWSLGRGSQPLQPFFMETVPGLKRTPWANILERHGYEPENLSPGRDSSLYLIPIHSRMLSDDFFLCFRHGVCFSQRGGSPFPSFLFLWHHSPILLRSSRHSICWENVLSFPHKRHF